MRSIVLQVTFGKRERIYKLFLLIIGMREVTSVVVAIVLVALVALVVGAVFGIYFLVFSDGDSGDGVGVLLIMFSLCCLALG